MNTPDINTEPKTLLGDDFKVVLQGIKAIQSTIPVDALPYLLCVCMFHLDAGVRKAAKAALIAHAPPALSSHVKADRRRYASMMDGKKILKAIKPLEPNFGIDPALFTRILVRVMALDSDLGKQHGGMTDQILLAALHYDVNADYVFASLAHAERLSLMLKGALPRGLGAAQSMKILTLAGRLKRADHIEELLTLPHFRQLDFWIEKANLALLAPLKDTVEAINFRGALSELTDISPLRVWSKLKEVDLAHTEITHIAPLRDMPITSLSIAETGVQDHDVLLSFPDIVDLNVSRNAMQDPSLLAKLPKLEQLNASHLRGFALAPFAGNSTLKRLQLWGQRFDDVSALVETQIESVQFIHCAINDLKPLADIASLKSVNLSTAKISGEFSIEDLKEARPDLQISG